MTRLPKSYKNKEKLPLDRFEMKQKENIAHPRLRQKYLTEKIMRNHGIFIQEQSEMRKINRFNRNKNESQAGDLISKNYIK